MKTFNTTFNKNNKKQKGLALTEMLFYLAIAAVILVGIVSVFNDSRGKLAHAQVKEEIGLFFPVAIQSCLSRTRENLSGCNAAKITTASISPLTSQTTPCGDTWSVTPSRPRVILVYQLDNCVDADGFGGDLAVELNQQHSVGAGYNSTTNDITVTYLR